MRTNKKDKIIETLYQEIKRKDAIIEKLKEENKVLIKTALRAAEEHVIEQGIQDSVSQRKTSKRK
jgi:hypothetical protein